ncbi:MAG: hypothetical protein ABGY95_05305 [Rubritalea sp.]|mgnify:CR=1 FL=1|uniref:hypothetical protein n=1 Tax=Rubritalea sp. TaxID=2109375 RepID=UPI003242ACD1
MPKQKTLPEHIQIIESLMLRSKQHRGIMIPTMLMTGIAALVLGTSLTLKAGRSIDLHTYPINAGSWISTWLAAALSALTVAFFFAAKQAKANGHILNTPQLRHVFRSFMPSLILGFVAGSALSFHDIRLLPLTASLWIASYGVALLSIRLYTTKSARFLGILMLALGLACFWVSLRTQEFIHPIHLANFFMAIAFGMFHLIVVSGSILFAKARA